LPRKLATKIFKILSSIFVGKKSFFLPKFSQLFAGHLLNRKNTCSLLTESTSRQNNLRREKELRNTKLERQETQKVALLQKNNYQATSRLGLEPGSTETTQGLP
jgi:hypothetical protein